MWVVGEIGAGLGNVLANESFIFSGILLGMHPLRLCIGILIGTLCPLRRHISILLGTLCPFKALWPVSLIMTSSLRASPVFFCVTRSCWPLYVPIYHVAFYPVCPKSHRTLKVTWTIPKLLCHCLGSSSCHMEKKLSPLQLHAGGTREAQGSNL